MLAKPTETALATAVTEAVGPTSPKRARRTLRAKPTPADLRDFAAYCRRIGALSLPADPAVVGTYLATIAETKSSQRSAGASSRSPRHTKTRAHRIRSHIATCKKVLAGIVRTKTVAQTRKDALTKDRLEEAVNARDGLERPARPRAATVDLRLCAALRRAEAAALDVADLRYDARGLVVTLRRSETDQEGQGREIGVPFVANGRLCAATYVRNWLEAAALVDRPVFRTFNGCKKLTANRIAPTDVARLVKRLTLAAGVEGDFAAHSLRAGFITSAAATKGVSEADIQRVSGHRSVAILRGYVRRTTVFDEAPLTAILSR